MGFQSKRKVQGKESGGRPKKNKEPEPVLESNDDEPVLESNDEPVRFRPREARAPAQVYCVCVRIRPGSTTYF